MSASFPAGENASPEPPESEENDPPVAPLDTFVSIVLKKPSSNVTVVPELTCDGVLDSSSGKSHACIDALNDIVSIRNTKERAESFSFVTTP